MECKICTSTNHMYPINCPGNHQYCLSCIKGMYMLSSPGIKTILCPECRHVTDRKYIKRMCYDTGKIQRIDSDMLFNDINSQTHIWLYEGRNNGWWYYDYDMQDILETAYLKNETNIRWIICGQNINIDLINMLQTNENNSALRSVKRMSATNIRDSGMIIKGVAGMMPK